MLKKEKSFANNILFHCKLLTSNWIISICLLVLPSFIAWCIFWPGYFQADHQLTIAGIMSGDPSAWHSLFWAYLSYPFFVMFNSFSIYGLFQMALFVCASIYSIKKLIKLKIIERPIILSAILGCAPPFILYNLLYSSDICFAYVLMCQTVLMIELVVSRGKALSSKNYLIQVACFFILGILLRSTAVFVVGVFFLLTIIIYHGYWKKIILVSLVSIFIALAISSTIIFLSGARSQKSQELLSVPSLQIASVFAENGSIPEDIYYDLTEKRSAEQWTESYVPYTADKAKSGLTLTFNFLKDWFVLGINNPKIYIKTYINLMCPYWLIGYEPLNTGLGIDFSSYYNFTTDNYKTLLPDSYLSQFNEDNLNDAFYFPAKIPTKINTLKIPIVTEIFNFIFFDRALPLWMCGFVLLFSLLKKQLKNGFIILIPILSEMIILLLFSPVSLLRYSMHTYYALPIVLVYIVFICKKSRFKSTSLALSR